jgi:hypothetical protein
MAALKFMKRKAPHGSVLIGTSWEADRRPGGRRELSDLRVYHVLDGVCSVGNVIGHKMAGKDGWEARTMGGEVRSGFGTRARAADWLVGR